MTNTNSLRSGLPTERAIAEATASLEMEGFQVDKTAQNMCRMLLQNELTMEEYIQFALRHAGVTVA